MRILLATMAFCCATAMSDACADTTDATARDAAGASHAAGDAPSAVDSAGKSAMDAMQRGPQTIALKDQARLALPEGYGFVPNPEATALMEASGNTVDQRFIGLVLPLSTERWFATIEYDPSGYVADDDAKDWNADALLENLREGTEAANAHREKIGVPAIEVTRWIEPPAYDAATHRLVWSAEVQEKNAPSDRDPSVNYNTYVLGREGYIALDLVTSASAIEAHKPAARELLAQVSFDDGKRYEQFDSSTDHIAAYGIAALIGGLAAKKLGLLAVAGAFLAKFATVIILGAAAVVGALAKLLNREKKSP